MCMHSAVLQCALAPPPPPLTHTHVSLMWQGVAARQYDAASLGVTTTDDFTNGDIIYEETLPKVGPGCGGVVRACASGGGAGVGGGGRVRSMILSKGKKGGGAGCWHA